MNLKLIDPARSRHSEPSTDWSSARVEPYREVRALDRGLMLMNVLGEIGWAGPALLAERTGIDRSTVYRLLATLQRADFVVSRSQDSKYFLSPHFRALGYGILEEDRRVKLTAAPMKKLVEAIKWPSDFAVLTGGHLTILDSTHPLTTMTFFRSTVGLKKPILTSALGRAILAGMSEAERADAVQMILLADGLEVAPAQALATLAAVIENFERRGYAASSGEVNANVGAIALPVRAQGRVVGGLNVLFFRAVFTADQVAERCLDKLRACVGEIEDAFEGKHNSISNLPVAPQSRPVDGER